MYILWLHVTCKLKIFGGGAMYFKWDIIALKKNA